MKQISIICDGGLGNRLGGLIGGLKAASFFNYAPVIYWPENNWCDCPYTDLFGNLFNPINQEYIDIIKNNDDYILMTHTPSANDFGHSIEEMEKIKQFDKNVIYINNKLTSFCEEKFITQTLESIGINHEIKTKVVKFCDDKKIDSRVHGIQIRLTDNPKKPNVEEIFDSVKKQPSQKFFVCSDDRDCELKFSTLPNVIINSKNAYVDKLVDGDWNSEIVDKSGRHFNFNVNRTRLSVIEAFEDMLILSKTNLAVSKKNKSTFFTFARYYAKTKNLN